MRRPFRVLLLSLACSASLAAQAQASTPINIPAGDLVPALDSLARQSGAMNAAMAESIRFTPRALARRIAGSLQKARGA